MGAIVMRRDLGSQPVKRARTLVLTGHLCLAMPRNLERRLIMLEVWTRAGRGVTGAFSHRYSGSARRTRPQSSPARPTLKVGESRGLFSTERSSAWPSKDISSTATNRTRSSILEHSCQGTCTPAKCRSVTHVFGTNCYPSLGKGTRRAAGRKQQSPRRVSISADTPSAVDLPVTSPSGQRKRCARSVPCINTSHHTYPASSRCGERGFEILDRRSQPLN